MFHALGDETVKHGHKNGYSQWVKVFHALERRETPETGVSAAVSGGETVKRGPA
jgi:hypothetical protein